MPLSAAYRKSSNIDVFHHYIKMEKVVQIFKSGKKNTFVIHRPISLLENILIKFKK